MSNRENIKYSGVLIAHGGEGLHEGDHVNLVYNDDWQVDLQKSSQERADIDTQSITRGEALTGTKMAGRKKNPELITKPVSVSLPKYQIDALRSMDTSQSEIVRAALDQYLSLSPPKITYVDQLPKTRKKK